MKLKASSNVAIDLIWNKFWSMLILFLMINFTILINVDDDQFLQAWLQDDPVSTEAS